MAPGWGGAPLADVVDIDGGGRFLVDRLIARRQNQTLFEIGSFLGGSTLRWLKASPGAEIVAIDPWPNGMAADFVARDEWWFNWPRPADGVLRALEAEDGLYHTFLANLAPHRDRVTPVWPRAQLTGDDYLWEPERGYPMQRR